MCTIIANVSDLLIMLKCKGQKKQDGAFYR